MPFPELRQIDSSEQREALREAKGISFDTVELIGLAMALVSAGATLLDATTVTSVARVT